MGYRLCQKCTGICVCVCVCVCVCIQIDKLIIVIPSDDRMNVHTQVCVYMSD